MSDEPKTIEQLRAEHEAAGEALAAAEAEAARGPPKTPEELEADHGAALKNLAALERLGQQRDHAKTALIRAQVEADPEKIAAAEVAHEEAIAAHEASPITSREIDIAAQAVLDARAALDRGE